MDAMVTQLITSVVSGLVGGIVTGIAAFAAIRVELKYLRRDVDAAHRRLDDARYIRGVGRARG